MPERLWAGLHKGWFTDNQWHQSPDCKGKQGLFPEIQNSYGIGTTVDRFSGDQIAETRGNFCESVGKLPHMRGISMFFDADWRRFDSRCCECFFG